MIITDHLSGLAMYRPTNLYDVCPLAKPAINASVRAGSHFSPKTVEQHCLMKSNSSPIHRSISPFFNLTCISPVPPGHSTSSKVLPSSCSASCRRGERKCSRCHPIRSLLDIVKDYSVEIEIGTEEGGIAVPSEPGTP